jgi:phage shock protein PspC (stress-responsive transcriptional regulator)
MFCVTCGFPLEAEDLFCRRCGCETPSGVEQAVRPKLRLCRKNRRVAGVCGGVARYLDQEPGRVRMVWAAASLLPFSPGLVAYAICWAVMAHEQKEGGFWHSPLKHLLREEPS